MSPREMQRQGFTMPLLIGGATTSRAHTALKIEPHYQAPTVWVKDASRAVGVAQTLRTPERSAEYLLQLRADYAAVRARHRQGGERKRLLAIDVARAQRPVFDWSAYTPPAPLQPGITTFDDYPLDELARCIDWTPFFNTWELSGHYPAILDDAVVGAQARSLFADAQAMLERIIKEQWLTARGVIGLWPAASVGDDVEVYREPGAGTGGEPGSDARRLESQRAPASARPGKAEPVPPTRDGSSNPGAGHPARETVATLHFLRQQADKPAERGNRCLADFIAPADSDVRDWIGGFAVTAGLGIEPHVARFEAAHDDYSAILLKSLADRLAEAFAERLHQRVRREFWGYAADETLDVDALIAERYRGIRPAPGYPACPEHSEKATLFALLDATRRTGMKLTDNYAMTPASSVAGWYFSHPDSRYFVVGRLGRDQIADYAQRKGWTVPEAERWLASWLDYDPE